MDLELGQDAVALLQTRTPRHSHKQKYMQYPSMGDHLYWSKGGVNMDLILPEVLQSSH